jgi:hypothetical protein
MMFVLLLWLKGFGAWDKCLKFNLMAIGMVSGGGWFSLVINIGKTGGLVTRHIIVDRVNKMWGVEPGI